MKEQIKRVLAVALSVLLLCTAIPLTASAVLESGTCGADGDNLTWTFDAETGELIISGTGDMADYSNASGVPWYSYQLMIQTVTIGSGVTSIGDYAF